eukprot:IDg14622t1
MQTSIAEIASGGDAAARTRQFANFIRAAVDAGDEARLRSVVTQVVEDTFAQVTARLLLVEFCMQLERVPDVLYKKVADYALAVLQPRAHAFESGVTALRERLATILERDGQWGAAAETLAMIPFDGTKRARYGTGTFVRIARLFARASRLPDAEPWMNRATAALPECTDEGARLVLRTLHAQMLDAKQKYVDAALKYYHLSQLPRRAYGSERVTATDAAQALQFAVACAILAPAGPRRSCVLAALYKDERARGTALFGLLEAIHMDRLLQAEQVEMLRPLLQPHQLDALIDGESVLDRAVVEHNLMAASKLYCNIKFVELGALLRVSPQKAETTAARMIYEKRMSASIDQVLGMLEFNAASQEERIESWDKQIENVCGAVDICVDAILQKYPQFAS